MRVESWLGWGWPGKQLMLRLALDIWLMINRNNCLIRRFIIILNISNWEILFILGPRPNHNLRISVVDLSQSPGWRVSVGHRSLSFYCIVNYLSCFWDLIFLLNFNCLIFLIFKCTCRLVWWEGIEIKMRTYIS